MSPFPMQDYSVYQDGLYHQNENEPGPVEPPSEPPVRITANQLWDEQHSNEGPRWWIIIGGGIFLILCAIYALFTLAGNTVHINWGQDPTPVSRLLSASQTPDPRPVSEPFTDLGRLPSDICLVDGKPVVLNATGGRYSISRWKSLSYINTSGNLVLIVYPSGGIGDPDHYTYVWAGDLCPSKKAEGRQ